MTTKRPNQPVRSREPPPPCRSARCGAAVLAYFARSTRLASGGRWSLSVMSRDSSNVTKVREDFNGLFGAVPVAFFSRLVLMSAHLQEPHESELQRATGPHLD